MREYTNISLNDLISKSKEIDSDFIDELKMFEENIDNLSEQNKFKVFYYLSNDLSFTNVGRNNVDLTKALNYAEKAENYIKDIPEDYKSSFYFLKGHIYARMEKAKDSEESFVKHIYFSSCEENFIKIKGSKIRKPNEFSNIPLYCFRTINKYSISDLVKNEITMADPNTFNDPFDTPLFSHLDLRRGIIKKKLEYDIKPMIDAYKHFKVRCFVKHKKKSRKQPFENQLMWSHYADSHRGICIRYKFDKEINIEDDKELMFSNWYNEVYKKEIKPDDPKSLDLRFLLATKEKCWHYENEARLVHFDPSCTDKYKPISIKESKIEAIFFGCRCTDEDKQTIRKIFPQKTGVADVEFFEFKFDLESYGLNTYKLNAKDMKRFKMLG